MTPLFKAEARRVVYRRLVRLVVALTCVLAVGGGILELLTTSSLSEATYEQRAQTAQARDQQVQAEAQRCVKSRGGSGAAVKDCLPNTRVRAHDPRFHLTRLKGILQGGTGVLALVAWLVGASLIGAEYQSRSLTTTLTFAPSRLNLFLAKAVAACAFGAVFALAAMTVTAAAMLPALALHGAPSAGEPHLATFAGLALRGAGLCTITAAIGFGIATIGRSTAAALGGGFAYIIIIENIIGSVWVKTRRWLFLGNAIVFVSGKNSGGEVPGRTVASAAMVITGVAGAWLIGATAAFANRDVS